MYQIGDILITGSYTGTVLSHTDYSITLDVRNANNKSLGALEYTNFEIHGMGWTLLSGVPRENKSGSICDAHDIVDVGFRFSRLVCRKCDKEIKVG